MGDNVEDCTVLVTDKIRRTTKFLCMVAKGVPIVCPAWITQSKAAGAFLDPWQYILKDEENEKRFGMKLEITLMQAVRKPLLASLTMHVTKKVRIQKYHIGFHFHFILHILELYRY